MNSSIHNLFNDIFSFEHNLDLFLNCIEKEKCSIRDEDCQSLPWRRRLEQFYDDFLKTEEGMDFKTWLPVPYDKQCFIEDYTTWFYFFHYFQKKIKDVGNRIFFKYLLLFQPLFLTKPFIFYIKQVLKLNYFYTYFVDLSKPSVFSLFKELESFTCYFPWYSGFTLLDSYELKSGIDKSNDHMQQYINNLVDYKELYGIHDTDIDKLHLHRFVHFIDFKDERQKEVIPGSLKDFLDERIKMKINFEDFLYSIRMDRLFCKKIQQKKWEPCGRIPITGDIVVSICINFCLQDILDKLVEGLRGQELPEIKSHFTIQKFVEIQKKNPYMKRFKTRNFEDVYYFSPQIDLFALIKIREDIDGMGKEHKKDILRKLFFELIEKNRDGNRNDIIRFLYKEHKNILKTETNPANILKLLAEAFGGIGEFSAKEIERDEIWGEIQTFLKNYNILAEVTENFGNLLVHFVFRKGIPKPFSRFDYCFIGLKLSNLRYILEKNHEYTDTSMMFYEIHQIAAFNPLEEYDEEIAQQRLRKVKNFFFSFIYIFATRIVSSKMSHYVEQKTAWDVTSKWAHSLKTRIEFLNPVVRTLKKKFPHNEEPEEKEVRNVVNILGNRVVELSKIAVLLYEFSKAKIGHYDILKGFDEFVRDFPKNPADYTRRHLVEILQDSISTALVRIITDDVYSVYIESRKKCINREFFTETKIPQSVSGGSQNVDLEINLENQEKLIFGKRGLSRIDRSTLESFLLGIYQITRLKGQLTIEYDNELADFINYFILEESKIGGIYKRLPMSTMISLLFDEILLNAFKYFDTNINNETYVKIEIKRPKVGFSGFRKNNGYFLPVTIKNSIGKEIKEINILRDIRDYRTGIQSINMGLSLLHREVRGQYFYVVDGKSFEYKFDIPVLLSGSDWSSEYEEK